MDVDSPQNIISFCTGSYGLELGLELAGTIIKPVCYVEIEAFAAANLVAKMEEGKLVSAPVWTDLKTFPAGLFRGKVHGITAGYPCQPFSTAGKRKGADDPRHLWPFIRNHVDTIKPVWCYFENVEGHLWLGFKEVFSDLRAMGYAVEAGLFTAAEVGAPHQRKRLFILSISLNCRQWKLFQQIKKQGSSFKTNIGSYGEIRSLENTEEHYRRAGKQSQSEKAGIGRGGSGSTDSELANTHDTKWTPGGKYRGMGRQQKSFKERIPDSTGKGLQGQGFQTGGECIFTPDAFRWPARPGQEQYDWEEPRTVKPGMGRTVDGFASRVDELRLLGNGVVPQQAAKAWIELNKKFDYEREIL